MLLVCLLADLELGHELMFIVCAKTEIFFFFFFLLLLLELFGVLLTSSYFFQGSHAAIPGSEGCF